METVLMGVGCVYLGLIAIMWVVEHWEDVVVVLLLAAALILTGLVGYASWAIWPLTGILVLVPSTIALVVRLRRRPWSERRPLISLALVVLAGGAVGFQIVEHGMPVAWWLLAGVASSAGVQIALRRPRDAASWKHKILISLRLPLVFATAGVALVVALQIVLAYRAGIAEDQVKDWIRALGTIRTWLEQLVWLAPWQLATVLLLLIAATAVSSQSLRVARSYRRIRTAASLGLLLVTTATSFTFFTAHRVGHWEGAWIARQGDALDRDLAEFDANRTDIVKLTAIEAAVQSLPEEDLAELRELATELGRYPPAEAPEPPEARAAREAAAVARRTDELLAQATRFRVPRPWPSPDTLIRVAPNTRSPAPGTKKLLPARQPQHRDKPERKPAVVTVVPRETVPRDAEPIPDREAMADSVAGALAKGVPIGPIVGRANGAIGALERAPLTSERARRFQAIERVRAERRHTGAGAPTEDPPRLVDVEVLGVELSGARAARREAYESVRELVLGSLTPHAGLTDALLRGLLDRIDIKPGTFTGWFDRRRIRTAMHPPGQPPPAVWHPEFGHALGAPAGASRTASAPILAGIAHQVVEAQQRNARKRAEEVEFTASERARVIGEQRERLGHELDHPELGERRIEPARPHELVRPREPARPHEPARPRRGR